MTPDPSGRLWTDPREGDEAQQWLRQRRRPPAPAPEPEEPPPPPGRPWRAIALGTLIAFVLFGTGVLAASVLRGGGDDGSTPVALPAAPGSVKPSALAAVAARSGPSVVLIRVQDGSSQGSGTGFVIDAQGTIVTAAHVVDGARNVQVRFDDHNETVDATVLGTDNSSDLAVLRAADTPKVTPLKLADSDTVRVGDPTIAIGYPLGLDRTVTAGIVSGVGRAIKAPNGFSIDKVIQTDASINPGNSGGPLLDGAGRVIGVNSQIATTGGGGGNIGIGFAVPSNTVREVVPRLEHGGTIRRPYLGVSTQASLTGQGAIVADVVGGGPAQAGGMQIDDIITSVAGKPVIEPDDISAAIESRRPGDEVEIEVRRAGSSRTLHVRLGTRPESVGTP